MLMSITAEQAQQVFPDANSQKAAKKLSRADDWKNKGASSQQWVWGEITGSAIYQSAIYLPELKFECSCPSFKRPCKHALGLLLCYVEHQGLFPLAAEDAALPERVQKWVEKKQKALKKADPDEPAKEVDLEARAKRLAAREKKVDDGLQALQLWLQDLLRMGLAKARTENYQLFNQINARLTDAQAAGLIPWVDALQSALFSPHWQQDSLPWLGRLNLVVQLWQRRTRLGDALLAELKQVLGFNVPTDQLDALPVVTRAYWNMGIKLGELGNNKGRYRRQWLWQAETQQATMLLDFEIGGFSSFPLALPSGLLPQLSLQYYPSPTPMRARLAINSPISAISPALPAGTQPQRAFATFSQALQQHAVRLEQNPLLLTDFWLLDPVHFLLQDDQLFVLDQHLQHLPAVCRDNWGLLAVVGQEACLLAAEWDGQQLSVISVWQDGQLTGF